MSVRVLSRSALCAALLCLCAWLSVPMGHIAVTMQTFALFFALFLLGGKQGSLVCALYLLLGGVGLPVFSGFRGGIGMLLGPTGGYLFGFLAAALAYWAIAALLGSKPFSQLIAACAALVACYTCGTLWFLFFYLEQGSISLGTVLLTCVVPYIVPDLCKLALAWLLRYRLRPYL